ncbi:MAG: EscU/YscU/HrcU family type III secretion system export apparatus switch protein, partial [Hyphomicrobiaceae bacterium]
LNNVPMATVVITNPTHFSIALRYDAETDPAPVVVAKGQDYLAQKIRTIAKENEVPLVENKTLARALYASVSVGSVIPSEFYKAVAEIILFLSSSKLVAAAQTRKS